MEYDNQEAKRRAHAELVEHLQDHSKQSFGALKAHMKTLSDDGNLSEAAREVIEQMRLHISRVQHATDEMLDYVILTQPGMPAPTLEEYHPLEVVLGVHAYFMRLKTEVDLVTNGSLPLRVIGMPSATRRALIHMAEYALRITKSNYVRLDARIEGQTHWRVRLMARFTPPRARADAPKTDAITMMSADTLRAMGGEVRIETSREELTITITLPFQMRTSRGRGH